MKWIECVDHLYETLIAADHIECLDIQPVGGKFRLVAWTTHSVEKITVLKVESRLLCEKAREMIMTRAENRSEGRQVWIPCDYDPDHDIMLRADVLHTFSINPDHKSYKKGACYLVGTGKYMGTPITRGTKTECKKRMRNIIDKMGGKIIKVA